MYNYCMPQQMPINGFNNPYEAQQRFQPINNSLIRVTGLDGARAYQMNPNSTVALFDNNDDVMYIKTTDGAGFPTIRCFEFKERTPKNTPNVSKDDFISRNEFNEFKKEVENYAKQFISKSTTSNDTTDKSESITNDKVIMQ